MDAVKPDRWYARELTAPEFSRRLRQALEGTDVRVVWFIGAGCSISSGIPAAAELVKRWLPQLARIRTGSRDRWEDFATRDYPGWQEDAARYYGQVIQELFESEEDRQREIERLTAGKDPGFGYAALAQLMSRADVGSKANVALTVNFDDLIADSLYLYTAKKPLVIGHEALTRFIRRGDRTPLVVKVHGDARLAPKNTTDETSALDVDLVHAVQRLCARARVVVVGYAGADESIARVFLQNPGEVGPEVIYWVNDDPPAPALLKSLRTMPQRVSWVHHLDFDSLMFELHSCFSLGLPDFRRLHSLQDAYESTLQRLPLRHPSSVQESDDAPSVEGLLGELRAARLSAQAESISDSDPDKADELFAAAIEADPTDAAVLASYARFLEHVKDDSHRAAEVLERALDADPRNAANLVNLANLFGYALDRPEEAEDLLHRALSIDPQDAIALANLAMLLAKKGDKKRADTIYRQAIALDPTHTTVLANYGQFLFDCGNRPAGREMMERAIELNPANGDYLGNYAGMLYLEGERDQAHEFAERARGSRVPKQSALTAELAFYRLCYEPDKREIALQELTSALPRHEASLPIDLSPHVALAKKSGHRDSGLIEHVALAIADGGGIEELSDYLG